MDSRYDENRILTVKRDLDSFRKRQHELARIYPPYGHGYGLRLEKRINRKENQLKIFDKQTHYPERAIAIRNSVRQNIVFQTKSLIVALSEVLEHDQAHRHNYSRPDLRFSDDLNFLATAKELLEELKRLNEILEKSEIARVDVKPTVKNISKYTDQFLSAFSTNSGRGAATLFIAAIYYILFHLDADCQIIDKLRSYMDKHDQS